MTLRPASFAFLTSLAALVLSAAVASADGWPQWRGPRADGISEAEGLPATWGPDRNLRWRLELPGPGASTPVVWGDRLYLTAAEDDALVLLAVTTGGEVAWRRQIDSGNYTARGDETNAASPSPVTDGERVWATLGTGTVAAFDADGGELWRTDLEERYGDFAYYFGMSSTPLLNDGTLYFLLLHTNSQTVAALDAATGEERWAIERPTDARAECLHSYASPVMFEAGGRDVLLIQGADYLTGHDPATGEELWRHGGLNPEASYNPTLRLVASPVAPGDGLVILPSAKNGPVYALEPAGAAGDITGVERFTRWKMERGTPDVPSPVVHDGLVYLSRENGILTVVDAASGEEVYAERVHGAPHRGSPVVADGKVFLVGNDGTVSVVRTGRSYQLLGQNDLDERLQASPVAVGDTLYLRTYEALYAIGQPAPAAASGPAS